MVGREEVEALAARNRSAPEMAGKVPAQAEAVAASEPEAGGRFLRQQVNRVRFGFYDRYENSAFDARPYSITGAESPKVSHFDNRFGANLGGPLKIPHIYDGSDKTYFFRELWARRIEQSRGQHIFVCAHGSTNGTGAFVLANAGPRPTLFSPLVHRRCRFRPSRIRTAQAAAAQQMVPSAAQAQGSARFYSPRRMWQGWVRAKSKIICLQASDAC